jgi:nucleotide-binding universal stress UspA family protein
MSTHGRPEIVVGVDGSDGADAALRWAAAQADRRSAALRLLFGFNATTPWLGGYAGAAQPVYDKVKADAEVLLRDRADRTTAEFPNVPITITVVEQDPRLALREASEHAELLVVGTHGRGRLAEVMLGSVALQVASHAHSPVAVVAQSIADPVHLRGPVVVGVDGSPGSEAALGFAFDAAARSGADLLAVHAWSDPVVVTSPTAQFGGQTMVEAQLTDQFAVQDAERAVLADRLTGWTDRYPDVRVRQDVVLDRPSAALLRYGRPGAPGGPASLIVVGSRGRGGFAGLLLGSTGQALITQAQVPVVVVRTPKHH